MRCTLMNIAAFLAMTLFMASCFADDASAQADAQQTVENAVESEVYPVPENGTPEEYLKFIEKLLRVERPHDQSREEMISHFTDLCKSQIAAADKVIEHKDATFEQIQRAVAVKINSLKILIKAGSKKAKILLYSMPAQLEKAGQSQIADEIVMGLITMTFQDAKKSNDFSEVEKIIEQTDQTIKKTPAEDKEKLQRLYLIKLICIKGLGQLKGVDNSADFEAVVAEIKKAGLSDMVEDIFMGKLANALSESVAQNDKAKFDKTAKAVDSMIADYGDKVNLKVVAIAFQTAFTEEVFDQAAAAARYEKYAATFGNIQDPKIQEIVKTMRGSAKRLTLKGKKLQLTGKTIDGKNFNMADLKDKKVLVYFWSPTIEPSLDELKYLRRAYSSYKAKGFEIVCIALDQNRKQVAAFVKKYKFPWINIWERDAFIGNVCITDYYGIIALPYMTFVGGDGIVLSTEYQYDSMVETLTEEFGELTVSEDDIDDIDIDDIDDTDVNDIDDVDDNADFDDANDTAADDADIDEIDDVDDNADDTDADDTDADDTDADDTDADDTDADDTDADDTADDDTADDDTDADDTADDDTADDDTADDDTADDDTADDDTADDDTADDDTADDDTADDDTADDDTADDDTADDDTADDDTADDDDGDDGADDGGDDF